MTITAVAENDLVARAAEQLVTAQLRLAEADREVEEISLKLNKDVPAEDRLKKAAENLLAGDPVDLGDAAVGVERLKVLNRERRILHRAIELGRRQVDQARADASAAVRGECRKEYAAILRDMADAIIALRAACQAEESFRDEVIGSGYSFNSAVDGQAMVLERIDNDDRFVRWITEAVRLGFIPESYHDKLRKRPATRLGLSTGDDYVSES